MALQESTRVYLCHSSYGWPFITHMLGGMMRPSQTHTVNTKELEIRKHSLQEKKKIKNRCNVSLSRCAPLLVELKIGDSLSKLGIITRLPQNRLEQDNIFNLLCG